MRKLTSLALAAILAVAACGEADDPANTEGHASGNDPERASAVNDTTPYRPGTPDTATAP